MTDRPDPSELQALESATRKDAAGAPSEERDAWLSLGRQLDAEATRGFNPDRLIAALREEGKVTRPPSFARRMAPYGWVAASVAVLVLALTLSWQLASNPVAVETTSPSDPSDPSEPPISEDPVSVPAVAWDDSLDLQLQQLQVSLQAARQGISLGDARYSAMESHLNEVQSDFQNDAL